VYYGQNFYYLLMGLIDTEGKGLPVPPGKEKLREGELRNFYRKELKRLIEFFNSINSFRFEVLLVSFFTF